jgi:hypothetical protein
MCSVFNMTYSAFTIMCSVFNMMNSAFTMMCNVFAIIRSEFTIHSATCVLSFHSFASSEF